MTISAKILADSINSQNIRLTTFELEYPRFIHAEFLTHRLFSRNAASSRAIPVEKSIKLIRENTARPIHWGKNQPGMSAKEQCSEQIIDNETFISREEAWNLARDNAIRVAEAFADAGYHKQIVNRILEPFTMIKVVCTATEFANFFWLRRHPDAQPEIQALAEAMYVEYEKTEPQLLQLGEWHVPYFQNGKWSEDSVGSLEDAIAISASCCAQVSYRALDESLEKARMIYKRLVESKPVHASPFEHQATPIAPNEYQVKRMAKDSAGSVNNLPIGTTHIDRSGTAWSGNFRGWIQNRQLLDGHTAWRYPSP
jgi:thymidylate synthase ThyX